MCLQRLKEAIDDQRTSKEQEIFSENEEKISYELLSAVRTQRVPLTFTKQQ
jgi:hypothetical protein